MIPRLLILPDAFLPVFIESPIGSCAHAAKVAFILTLLGGGQLLELVLDDVTIVDATMSAGPGTSVAASAIPVKVNIPTDNVGPVAGLPGAAVSRGLIPSTLQQ